MRENRTSGSVRGALGNRRSYRERVNPKSRCLKAKEKAKMKLVDLKTTDGVYL